MTLTPTQAVYRPLQAMGWGTRWERMEHTAEHCKGNAMLLQGINAAPGVILLQTKDCPAE